MSGLDHPHAAAGTAVAAAANDALLPDAHAGAAC